MTTKKKGQVRGVQGFSFGLKEPKTVDKKERKSDRRGGKAFTSRRLEGKKGKKGSRGGKKKAQGENSKKPNTSANFSQRGAGGRKGVDQREKCGQPRKKRTGRRGCGGGESPVVKRKGPRWKKKKGKVRQKGGFFCIKTMLESIEGAWGSQEGYSKKNPNRRKRVQVTTKNYQ